MKISIAHQVQTSRTSEAPLSLIVIFSPPLIIPESYLKSIGSSLGLKDFSYVSIEFN